LLRSLPGKWFFTATVASVKRSVSNLHLAAHLVT
jgi:hypothetical protein